MSGAQTSGSDIHKAATAFSDGAGQIQQQVQNVTESKVTPEKAGKKFHQAGTAYKQALDKLGGNIKSFAEHGTKLSESFSGSAKQYQSSDHAGADEIRKVQA